MPGVSVCITLKNRADLFKWCLESLSRQETNLDVEICVADGGSTDNLITLIDRYSERFRFIYAVSDRSKAYYPVATNCPAADLNVMIQNMPTYDTILKLDPEIVLKDAWIIDEMYKNVQKDPTRTYNARVHFTEGSDWYNAYEDIISRYEQHYHIVDGGPFSRSKFYFCSGFSRTTFVEMGGVDERFCIGDGYEDTCFREHWKNTHGNYEYEITGQAIHLWHPPTDNHSPGLYELNRRQFEQLKGHHMANIELNPLRLGAWANPKMLSYIYKIEKGAVTESFKVSEEAEELFLPF